MFWVKDNEGNLVNIALAEAVIIDGTGETKFVRAIYARSSEPAMRHTLFIGTREDCGKFRDKLFLELTANQRCVHVIDWASN